MFSRREAEALGARRASPPKGNGCGEAMSSSPLEVRWEWATRTSLRRPCGGRVKMCPTRRRSQACGGGMGNMPGRHEEECRRTRSAALAARVGIGIGIAIGIENEAEHEVRTRTRSRSGCACWAKGSHANRGISVDPPGACSIVGQNPALTRWATFCRPSGPAGRPQDQPLREPWRTSTTSRVSTGRQSPRKVP